ncbi:MAG: GNAT family N-acetyltransferase [Lachnospiraceae bacterium]|nr:GNAT family N-acetyltransferase [Lachnospiraceae bacterium]
MIREIQEKDIAECVDVIRESFLTVADELGYTAENAPRFTAFATTQERLQYHFEAEHRPMYAYYDDVKIIGYYSLALQENNECELNNLCVLPQYRHRQIGKKLLEDAYAKAKEIGCKKMNIGIVEENIVLRKWYEGNGFVHVGTKKFDFFPFTCGYMKRDLCLEQ